MSPQIDARFDMLTDLFVSSNRLRLLGRADLQLAAQTGPGIIEVAHQERLVK